MSPAREVLDTNILVYAFSTDQRSMAAERLLGQGGAVCLQSLNEFANVARRKLAMSWAEVQEAIASIRILCPTILPMDIQTHDGALDVAGRYNLSFFDALIVSAALRAGCETLWSEDMQDGLLIEGRLRISNPFVEV
jgi:predicted nucleic acid-binding protein